VVLLAGASSVLADGFGLIAGLLLAMAMPITPGVVSRLDGFFSGVGLALCGAALAGLVRTSEPPAVRARWLAERAARLAVAQGDDRAAAAGMVEVERLLQRVDRRDANALWAAALPKVHHAGALRALGAAVQDPLRREAVLRQRVLVEKSEPGPWLDLAEHLVSVAEGSWRDPERALNLVYRAQLLEGGAEPALRQQALDIALRAQAQVQQRGAGVGLGAPPP
jgi:hypothetical protein